MPTAPSYESGDVISVEWEYTNGTGWDYRPAVVLSTKAHNDLALDLVLAQISTQMHQRRLPGSVLLQDWQQAGLDKPSIVKPALISYPLTRRIKGIGQLSLRDRKAVKLSIATLLGFRLSKPTSSPTEPEQPS